MKHLIIFLAYQNTEIVIKSFESIFDSEFDYFIIENFSENSDEIKSFFLNKNLLGYIQFEENIAANAINIFIKDFFYLFNDYEYVTITDGDLYVFDIKNCMREIKSAFIDENCMVSGASLYQGNNYKNINRIIGIEYYLDYMKNNDNLEEKSIFGKTGNYLLTFNKNSFNILNDIHYIDTNIYKKINDNSGNYYRTNKNLVYHLTWDLYFDGNNYYEFKKNNIDEIWSFKSENFNYNRII
jgi:hypothetical protein